MVFLVRTDLKMTNGKIALETGNASIIFFIYIYFIKNTSFFFFFSFINIYYL
jgi:hypothetical protein